MERRLRSRQAAHCPPEVYSRQMLSSSYHLRPHQMAGEKSATLRHGRVFEVATTVPSKSPTILAWRGNKPEQYSELDEDYDLIIVGGGISGLAAAYLYQQQAGADKKILILDNHDDFGGHAKRNEFQLGDRTLLGPGGSFNLEHYSFSDTAARVISELGIDLDKLGDAREPDFLLAQLNSSQGYFLNEEHYGQNKIIQGHWPSALEGDEDSIGLIKELGLSTEQHQRLLDLINGEKDLLDDLSLLETKDYIAATSYEEFLIEKAETVIGYRQDV